MAVHEHRNQELLDAIGIEDGLAPYQLSGSGETPDTRTWSVTAGIKDAAGNPIDAAGTSGVSFRFIRASGLGMIFARPITVDKVGCIVAVGPEVAVTKAGSSVFETTAGGVTGRKSAKIGDADEFFVRTHKGLQARKDFLPESETPFMRPTGEDGALDVELKPGSGG